MAAGGAARDAGELPARAPEVPAGFLARGMRRLRRLRSGRGSDPVAVAPDLPPGDAHRLRALVEDALARRDTGSRRAETAAVADAYATLDHDGRRRFLLVVARDFGTDRRAVDRALVKVRRTSDAADRRAAEDQLRRALVPASARALRLFTGLESGVKFLVDLRADLLALRRDEPDLVPLERELHELLATLFDAGLLELRRITWDAPASLLEKLAQYEAVHAIDSWEDLKHRLEADRRWYAFFHPAMPAEPLIFVEVALTRGLATELAPLLDEDTPAVAPGDADTAIFYSISNCQPGLAAVNLGNVLIKQVVEELSRDRPSLATFATLSPVPGFRAWLDEVLAAGALRDGERTLLDRPPEDLRDVLGRSDWPADPTRAAALEPFLVAVCARYLTEGEGGRSRDPVANFHLSNGAAVERIDWLANPTPAGLQGSAGLMVNYRYEPERIPERAERYAADGTIAVAPAVRDLVRG